MSQEEIKSITVRIAAELIEPIDYLIKEVKDEFGIPLFRSRCDLITKAVKEFLKKYNAAEKVSEGPSRSASTHEDLTPNMKEVADA